MMKMCLHLGQNRANVKTLNKELIIYFTYSIHANYGQFYSKEVLDCELYFIVTLLLGAGAEFLQFWADLSDAAFMEDGGILIDHLFEWLHSRLAWLAGYA